MPTLVPIDFSKPFGLFPLADVCLLPHASSKLNIFEPRYVQMITEALEGTKQFAMASFAGDAWRREYHGNPPIRPVVCVVQIEQHQRAAHGGFVIAIQGICRARIVEEELPDPPRLYRRAHLAPLESHPETYEMELSGWRDRVRELLGGENLSRLRLQPTVLEWFDSDEIPSHVLLEMVGFFLVTSATDLETRYQLLSEADVRERAAFTERGLRKLDHAIEMVADQVSDWPKGLSWN